MWTVFVATVTAFITSVVCCNISSLITFKTIDRYVDDMIETTKDLTSKLVDDLRDKFEIEEQHMATPMEESYKVVFKKKR